MLEMHLELCTLINCFQIKWKQKRYKCKIWSEDDAIKNKMTVLFGNSSGSLDTTDLALLQDSMSVQLQV